MDAIEVLEVGRREPDAHARPPRLGWARWCQRVAVEAGELLVAVCDFLQLGVAEVIVNVLEPVRTALFDHLQHPLGARLAIVERQFRGRLQALGLVDAQRLLD